MLEIEKSFFKVKFSEIHIRQRLYQKESFVTVQIRTEFYPTLAQGKVVSGAVEIQLDLKDIHQIDDLSLKKYSGEIGSLTISINNEGVWEHQTLSSFSISFKERVGREITFVLDTAICKMEVISTIVSLYTTSTDKKELTKYFDMKDFYDVCVQRKIGASTVSRFYMKD